MGMYKMMSSKWTEKIMIFNEQELLSFDQIRNILLALCVEGETGYFDIFTEENHTAVISLYEGSIVGLWYRIAQGCDAVLLIKDITKARVKFNNNSISARPTHITRIPPTVDILIALGVDPGNALLRKLGKKVLVVEDSNTQRRVICKILSENGYLVREASDGYKALELLEEEKPDLILLDIIMPGIDGYKVMSAIQEQEHMKTVPIFMLTSKDTLIDKMRGKISGANEYLTKPYNSEELMGKINEYLRAGNSDEIEEVAEACR